ncbi:MAG: STAS/SEC14 domain-containing protein [Planococcus sp. (in: firmicutes)]|uniref:STAS/SEC14 domain-containing protein n=1 Tax=Planococcus halocryophilus TaxID=1215089 RepID=UPI001F100450|nr:STAS/SEC14 domain-containing protein [Planococcus halocryophilus]MCH4827673.1 STAS/SEC14 domain-containing protein [Planococcus halocryophilus]
MLSIVPSKDVETIAIEFEGAVTHEDAMKIDKIIQDKYVDKGQFNIYAIISEEKGASFHGLEESIRLHKEAWNHFHKFAVISSSHGEEQLVEMKLLLPDIEVKYFKLDEMNEAWEWIQE